MKRKFIITQLLVIIIAFMVMFSFISYGTSEMYTWQVSANIVTSQNIIDSQNSTTNQVVNNVQETSSNTIVESSENLNKQINTENNKTLPTSAEIENNNSLNLTSGAGILIEQSTGQVLYSHNSHEKLRPASVTKVMSILIIMEQLDKRKFSINR